MQGQPPPPPPYYGGLPPGSQPVNQQQPPPGYSGPGSYKVGSLGTPKTGWQGSSSLGDGRWKQSNNPYSHNVRDVLLVPTRPLLKALARECKPCPPWCVGHPIPDSLSTEMGLFAQFIDRSPQEQERMNIVVNAVAGIIKAKWPTATVSFMGINAAGIFPPESTIHLCAVDTSNTEGAEQALRAAANELGFQASFATDYRGCQTAVLTEARTGDRVAVRFGPLAAQVREAAKIIETEMSDRYRKWTLMTLEALLRQNKVLDESGTSPGIPSEAVCVMLIAIANSYDEADHPPAERLLKDFFLTYGFPAHFDNAALSVDRRGMTNPVPKVHKDAALSVLDPANPDTNLAAKVEKVPHILAVFNYCYTAISQFAQSTATARRAQSALSTIIGGETYWSRVLHLYHQRIEPFCSVVQERQASLSQFR